MATPATESFRVHTNAAPLKPVPTIARRPVPVIFPRSHERGPIEAIPTQPPFRSFYTFRVHTNAAPLKPILRLGVLTLRQPFPRSHERGPIEASRCSGAFRLATFFPRSHERGPIEAR